MSFLYETHVHTDLISACSQFAPREIIEKYTRLGFAGLFVTDHFFNNGSCRVKAENSWRERVERFFEGYEAVKAAAEKIDVFFGFEYSYFGTDFLVYGFEKEQLIAHPEIMDMTVNEFCEFVRGEGALVIQAHPFREADYIDHIRLFPSAVDGIEVLNANRDARTNRLAENLANEYGLFKTAGSDIHGKEQYKLAGMAFPERLKNERDFIARVKRGEGEIVSCCDGLYQ